MVGTPVYNISGCNPAVQGYIPSHHPPAHPAVKWVPSLYKARVDKPLIVIFKPVVDQVGLRVPTPLILHGATVSAPANTRPGFRSLFCAGPLSLNQGTWLCQGCVTRKGSFLICVCMCVYVHSRAHVCACMYDCECVCVCVCAHGACVCVACACV